MKEWPVQFNDGLTYDTDSSYFEFSILIFNFSLSLKRTPSFHLHFNMKFWNSTYEITHSKHFMYPFLITFPMLPANSAKPWIWHEQHLCHYTYVTNPRKPYPNIFYFCKLYTNSSTENTSFHSKLFFCNIMLVKFIHVDSVALIIVIGV